MNVWMSEADQQKANALAMAKKLHKEAQEEGSPVKYERAAEYYTVAGKDYQADVCRMAADVLRR